MTKPLADNDSVFQPLYWGWGESQSFVGVAEVIAAQIQLFLQLDRVVVYQFDPHYNGQVIAEACDETRLPTLLGLHFPASDIPPQARSLFLKSRQRLIIDVVAKQKTLFSESDSLTKTGDWQQDIRYAPVDPCHLQYLLGLGVLSSITYSIVYQGKLWGLLVGHHSDPRRFSEAEIQTVQLWVDQLAIALAQELLRQQVQQHQQQKALLDDLTRLLQENPSTAQQWQTVLSALATAFQAAGCRLSLLPDVLDQEAIVHTYGIQPAIALESEDLWIEFCRTLEPIGTPSEATDLKPGQSPILVSSQPNWQTHAQKDLLAKLFEPSGIRSVLMVPIQGQDQVMGYLSCYRQAEEISITWAGQHNPDPRNRLPRASFASWREQCCQVRPWSPSELELAQAVSRHLYMNLMQHWVKARLHLRSAHDAMTQLPNWWLFSQQLQLAILQCLRQGKALAVAILDLVQFKRINTTYGHTFGNYLLQAIAHRISQCLQYDLKTEADAADCMLARWHGDKFALLLPAAGGKEEINRHAQMVLASLQRPFFLQGKEVYLTASLGIAVAPYDGTTVDLLLQHAEVAMYQAKRQGHGSYLIYTPHAGMEGNLSRQMLSNDLYRALTQQELVLYFQPQIDTRTEQIVGIEALVRWQHPQLGMIPPDQFIPIAEETGLISQLDEWVLRTACLQYHQWRQAGLPPMHLAVNQSAKQFESSGFVKLVGEVLQETGMQAAELELEITEETITRDIQYAVAMLKRLKAMGAKIALDDFGTGYSSLSVLKHFPVDTLKIDKSFVRDYPKNPQDAAIVQTIVALGHGLNLTVLAEGVETPAQATWLQELECDRLQGHFLSFPQPASALFPWLQQQSDRLPPNRPPHLVQTAPPSSPQSHSGPPHSARSQPTSTGMNARADAPPQDDPQPEPPLSISSMTAALQPNRMHHQLQREQLIRSVTEKIRQSLHLDDILSTIVEEVRHLLDTDRVILYQFAENWQGKVVQASAAPNYPSLIGMQIDDKCFAEKFVKYYRQGRVRAIEDIQTADIADCHREMLSGLEIRANLVVPVTYQDQLWGLLIAHHCRGPRPWRQDELELLGQLAVQSAIAIHQGELYQQLALANRELQQLSIQDSLTHLANRHYFDQKLVEEWQRLQRSQTPLSLILCDIDYFKQYNDTYGHPAGDRCLQQVAQILQTAAQRPGDLVARYGGEEFVILMPETDLAGARLVAEKIQQALGQLAIPHGGSSLQTVTLSLGIACQVPHAQGSPDHLIRWADEGLYAAKANGRNQIKTR